MRLRNANPAAKVTGLDELAGTSNYFIGNDPKKWRTGVPTYAKVKYEGIYSGIDLVYYGNRGQLEYDFIVAPGADPRRIAFDVRGASRIRQDMHGELVFTIGDGEVRWHRPVVYQEKDPTFLGGSRENEGWAVAVDSVGNAYVTGFTYSSDFPVTPGAFQMICDSNCSYSDAFVAKVNPSGSALVYSTYLGGSGNDGGRGIAVDSSGGTYVTGFTDSSDFPTTPGTFQTTCGSPSACGNAFVTKFNSTGSVLDYSTYLGGNGYDVGSAIAVDSAGDAYVTGSTWSKNFPTQSPLQKKYKGHNGDAFVIKINSMGSALFYSTYLGDNSYGVGIAVDSSHNSYVTGYTYSATFPVTPGALQTTCESCPSNTYEPFVAKIFIAATTTTTLTSSPNPSGDGQAVTFTATVTSGLGTPPDGETVSFMKGKTVLGTGTLSGGSASFTISTLKVGTNSITAVYGGDSDFSGSTSKPVKQVVEKAGAQASE